MEDLRKEELKEFKQKKKFSIIARIRSSNHALRGLGLLIRTGHNVWGHIFFGFAAIYLGFLLEISNTEWMILIIVIGLVLFAEAVNTAIEIDIDLTSPEFHPYARDSKDVVAGAVSITVVIACVIALFIFLPKVLAILEIIL